MRFVLTAAMLLSVSLALPAQQTDPPPPFQAKRLPPEKTQNVSSEPVTNESPTTPTTASAVPPGFKPKVDVLLTKTAEEAVQLSEDWMKEHNQPAVGRDGRVVYSYGAGLPTVVCAPLRVCIIELQPGEKLAGEPHIGDSVRWNIAPALFGHGDSTTPVIVLKPQSPGLDTNLLVTTDRRAYYLRLVSKPEDYVARVAFAYPDDAAKEASWKEQAAKQKEQERNNTIAEVRGSGLDSLFFDYQIKGKNEALKPVRVFDDGQKTFIQISHDAQTREAPVLVVRDKDGKQEMVNYRVKGNMYIVDRLFDHAELVLGSGKKTQKVEIERERKS